MSLFNCPYFQGTGTCESGCVTEPSCMTDRPSEGWPEENSIFGWEVYGRSESGWVIGAAGTIFRPLAFAAEVSNDEIRKNPNMWLEYRGDTRVLLRSVFTLGTSTPPTDPASAEQEKE